MIGIKSIEHGIAVVAHEIVVGAKAVTRFVGWVQKEAPAIENITALIDPRAATIERIGAALIGQVMPQVFKAQVLGADLKVESQTPTVTLTAELVQEIQALYQAIKGEVNDVQTAIASGGKVLPAPVVFPAPLPVPVAPIDPTVNN